MPAAHLCCYGQQCSSSSKTMRSHPSRSAVSCYLPNHLVSTSHVSTLWPSQQRHHTHRSSSSSRRALVTAAAQSTTSSTLVDWVISNGGSVSKGVKMANLAGSDGGSGWGLVATEAIDQAGTRLIHLPRSCQLSYDESTDPHVLRLIEQVPEELWGAKLAIQFLVQRVHGQSSPFYPYISQLPVGVSGIPMFFDREALEAIEYPPVVEQVKKRGRWLHRFSTDVLSKLPGSVDDPFDGCLIDINGLGWALAVVTSRAFRVSGPSAPAALLPLIDMANHSFEPNCEVVPVYGGVAMVAKRQIAAGEPLLLSYGKLSNDFLLMDYGFVVPNNPHDRVALKFDINLINEAALSGGARDHTGQLMQLTTSPAWKQIHLQKLNLFAGGGKPHNLQVLLGGPNIVEPRLLAAIRGLVATYQSEVENLTLEVLGSWDRPLNKQNETATIRILIGLAMIALQKFTTGLQPDLDLLAGSSGSSSSSSGNGTGTTRATGGASSSGSSSSSGNGMVITAATEEVSSSSSTSTSSSSSSSESVSSPGTSTAAAAVDLDQDLRLAIMFRSQRKQLLLDVIAALAEKLKQVPRIAGLRESPIVAARKGQKPKAASSKGFGKG